MSECSIVTVEAVAKALQVSPRTIHTWRKRFGLPFKKIGGALRFDMPQVLDWFRNWSGDGKSC